MVWLSEAKIQIKSKILLHDENSINISKDFKTRFDTPNYELDRQLMKEKNEIVIKFIKDKLGGKIMRDIAALKDKRYSSLTDNNEKDKNSKRHKRVCHKTKS